MGLLNGKVAIVTGAGGGLGRAYALLFAKEGAAVIVNDLGGTMDGQGSDASAANKVAEEIKALGGKAAPNYANVTKGDQVEAMIRQAVDTFGRLDILVNNAGILRDKTLLNTSEENWDIVNEVHAKGTFLCTKAAVAVMKEHGNGGRIINTTSFAGLKGNFGQSNYACAKAGIWGFTNTVALETSRLGITANCIAPMAQTRMTENIALIPKEYLPEHVAVMALYLASDLSEGVTGRTFGVHGTQLLEYVMEITDGVTKDAEWTPGEIKARLADIGKTAAQRAREQASAAPAAPAAATSKSPQELAFEHMHLAFVPDKAEGWKAGIFFEVAGGKDYTITVGGGSCTTAPGRVEPVTCSVKLGVETIMGMIEGTVDPQAAFMAGKIKADNLQDMIKFGRAFNFKLYREKAGDLQAAAAAPAAAPAPAASGKSPQELAFEHMHLAFVPDKAEGWKAGIFFEVAGGKDYTITVGGGSCSTAPGRVEPVTCSVKLGLETIMGMIEGTVDPQAAFMAGKIKADNLQDMIKFGRAFNFKLYREKAGDLQAAAAAPAKAPAAAAAAPATAAPAKPAVKRTPTGLNLGMIGRKYEAKEEFAYGADMEAYADSTNDPNPSYRLSAAAGQVAPPIYVVAPMNRILTEVLMDEELGLNLLMLVHGEQRFTYHRPLRPWDLVCPRAEITNIESKDAGDLVTIRTRAMVNGESAVDGDWVMFVRNPGGSKKSAAEEEKLPSFTSTQTLHVDADQSLRYAKTGRDNNPIHVDEAVAKQAGLPGIILHGLCSMAFASQALVSGPAKGDSTRLRQMGCRFSKFVLMGDDLTTRLWVIESDDSGTTYGFDTVNQHGVRVLSNGTARVSK